MDKNIYKLANQIQAGSQKARNAEGKESSAEDIFGKEKLDDRLKEYYQRSVLDAIHKDRRMTKRKRLRTAAACLAVLIAATMLFHNEVRAAIGRISYSLSMALGLDSDLAEYKEVIHTSVSDGGYMVTLQEAVAAPKKFVVSYTVEREDGRAFTDGFDLSRLFGHTGSFDLEDSLYINGTKREQHLLDTQETVLGGKIAYDLAQMDLSGENTYDLRFHSAKGNWNFRFQADGTELYADTKRMTLGSTYQLPNGVKVMLDELTVNDLEQRITMHILEGGDISGYVITLLATDEQGRTAEFYAADVQGAECMMYAEEYVAVGVKTEQGQVFKGTKEKQMLMPFGSDDPEVVWEMTDLR